MATGGHGGGGGLVSAEPGENGNTSGCDTRNRLTRASTTDSSVATQVDPRVEPTPMRTFLKATHLTSQTSSTKSGRLSLELILTPQAFKAASNVACADRATAP